VPRSRSARLVSAPDEGILGAKLGAACSFPCQLPKLLVEIPGTMQNPNNINPVGQGPEENDVPAERKAVDPG